MDFEKQDPYSQVARRSSLPFLFSSCSQFTDPWEMITDEDKKVNATYIISVARKLGCSVFLLWDDIVEVSACFRFGLLNKAL